MRWSHWLRHFEDNAERPVPVVEGRLALSPQQIAALTLSLQKFQLGETGEGRLAHQVDGFHGPGIDDDFRACVKLFVREEGRHARILGLLLRSQGVGLLGEHWSARSFGFFRRSIGVRTKLLVALAAEVVGGTFYGLLAEVLGPSSVASALRQIGQDEDAHLAFQTDFFASQLTDPVQRALWCWLWRGCGAAASAVVLLDHATTFRVLGISRTLAARRLWTRIEQVVAGVRSAPRPRPRDAGPAAFAAPAMPVGRSPPSLRTASGPASRPSPAVRAG
jgi:hypothetical protein